MGDELEDLKYNLKVSFTRMKDDIHYNRDQIKEYHHGCSGSGHCG